jgi:hypothetical protein
LDFREIQKLIEKRTVLVVMFRYRRLDLLPVG